MSSPESGKHQIEVTEAAARAGIQLEPEVNRLLEYLDGLLRSPSATDIDWQQTMYHDLVKHFKNTALEYARLADNILPCAARHDPKLSIRYYYEEVLKKIADHVRLLAQLFVRLDDTSTEPGEISELDAIQAIIWDASKHIPGERPVLIPMLSTQFMYVHLNYVSGVGFIGVPPYALVRPYPDLPILWHEVAGYWVAQERASGNALKERARGLQDRLRDVPRGTRSLWDGYRDQYAQSVSHNARVKLTITEDSIWLAELAKLVRYFARGSHGLQEPNVDTDYDWQMLWLGQILEDLFGVRYLGETMERSLAIALESAYETPPEIGDHKHPPSALRLKIAAEYLRGDQESILEIVKQETDETRGMAKIIAAYLLESYPRRTEESPLNSSIPELVARFTNDALNPQLDSQRQKLKKSDLTTDPAIRSAFKDFEDWRPTNVVQVSNQIWEQAGFTELERAKVKGAEPCGDLEEDQRCLEHLRSIVFIDTDESGPYGPAFPVPKK